MKAILSQLISRDLWNNDHEERDLFLDNSYEDFLLIPFGYEAFTIHDRHLACD